MSTESQAHPRPRRAGRRLALAALVAAAAVGALLANLALLRVGDGGLSAVGTLNPRQLVGAPASTRTEVPGPPATATVTAPAPPAPGDDESHEPDD